MCPHKLVPRRGPPLSRRGSRRVERREWCWISCILSARYSAYLEKGFKNDVGSSGSPITSTPRFNALTSTLVLAILHHQTQHPIWGSLLERMGNRNLALVRCHPDVDKLLGLDHFI